QGDGVAHAGFTNTASAQDRYRAGSGPFQSERDEKTPAENYRPAAAPEGRILPQAARHRCESTADARTGWMLRRGGSAGRNILPFKTCTSEITPRQWVAQQCLHSFNIRETRVLTAD